MKKILALICLSLPVSSTFAIDWQVNVLPYLWAMNMNGRVVNGPLKTHVHESFGEIMRQFDAGGMLWIDAHRGPFGVFFNGLYAQLSDHAHIRFLDAHLNTDFGILSAGFSYIILEHCFNQINELQLEPYVGTRYTFNDVTLKLADFIIKNNQSWNDPLVGMRVRYHFNSRWLVELAGDLGGTNGRSHYSYNAIGLIGYQPCSLTNTAFYLGYRDLYQHYDTGRGLKLFKWHMRLFGPLLGVNFNF